MYQFGPFTLDPVAIRLTHNGQKIEVEPQLFDTLLLLLKHRERVVSKDELLENIWQDRVVTESVITRTIYELRKVLDKDSNHTSAIRTVRGKGYQFVQEVIVIEKQQGAEVHSIKTKSSINQSLLFLLLLSLLLVLGFVLHKQDYSFADKGTVPEPSAPVPALPERNKNLYAVVTVLPIKVDKDNVQLSMLVQSLIDYLIYQLESNFNMKVIHPDSLLGINNETEDIWAIQKATRSDFILQGFIEPTADKQVNLHLTLYKNNSAGELTPFSLGAFDFQYPQNIKELNDLYKQRKVTVRNITEIIKPGMTVKDNGDYETNDPEAYRLVIAAHHISRSDDCKDMQRAEALLLKAVKRDDEFVYAYLQLFSNYYKRVWICGESTDYHEKGLAMAKKIDELYFFF